MQKAPLTDEKMKFTWRLVVGPAMDRATTIELENQVLRVRAKDPAWVREVERSTGLIRERLDGLLGENVVAGIVVVAK